MDSGWKQLILFKHGPRLVHRSVHDNSFNEEIGKNQTVEPNQKSRDQDI